MLKRLFSLMGPIAFLMVARACGSGDDSSSEPTEIATTEPTETATTEPTETAIDLTVGVIEAYRVAYNADDMDAVVALFTEESVLTGYAGFDTSWTGLDEIREATVEDRASSTDVDAYAFVDVEVTGDTVTWNHTWLSRNGVERCGEGHSEVID